MRQSKDVFQRSLHSGSIIADGALRWSAWECLLTSSLDADTWQCMRELAAVALLGERGVTGKGGGGAVFIGSPRAVTFYSSPFSLQPCADYLIVNRTKTQSKSL